MELLHGGQVVAKALKKEGVSHLFTLCGGHIQAIYDGCLSEGIRVVDTRHEQTAVHAADGWARVTGQPGVAAVTAGPGVTNAVTAIASAYRAQAPMVVIGGQGSRIYGPFGGQDRGSLQEMNSLDMLRPITKWAVSVPESRRLGEYVQSAFRVAVSGVPGPVFLEMPIDLLFNGVPDDEMIAYGHSRTDARPAGDPRFIEQAAELLAKAERPMLIIGSQWRWSPRREGLAHFLEAATIPAFLNGMARGALPKTHPSNFKRARSAALKLADAVLVIGTPLDFRLGYGEKIGPQAKLIQVDLDGGEIGRNRPVDVGLVGDAGFILDQLAEALGKRRRVNWKGWLDQVRQVENEIHAPTVKESKSCGDPINPLRVCEMLNRFIDDKTIVVGDGGDFVATASYLLDIEGVGNWMDPGPLGTLGVGPGYAMAARLARPDHKVVLVMGDGAFGFHAMEFEAMVRQNIPVVCIVGNDARWTQIYRGQAAMYGAERAVATTLDYTRYDQVAAALGAQGEYVEKFAELKPALERAFAADKPVVVNVRIGQSDFRKDAMAV
ncbi:MAG: acetolactate synthase [Myxococcales bacterium]|nr:MAG: acetolactate synthase [Myxococcales bacterium]